MKLRILLCTCAVYIAFLLFSSSAWSHPHVFLTSSARFVFDEKGLAGIRVQWVFDDMFSSSLILDFNKSGTGRFNPTEAAAVKKDFFMPLQKLDFFTHIKIDGKAFKVGYVTGFTPEIKNGIVVIGFFVPCHVPADNSFHELKVSLYDQSYYHSVALESNPVSYDNNRFYEVSNKIETNMNEAYYYGQVYPDEITMKFRKKHG